jgi:SAM-dependent methyltransferase
MAPDGSQFSGRERLSPPVDVDPVRMQDDHASWLQRSRAAWDARAERWDARAEVNALAPDRSAELDRIWDALRLRRDAHVLDAGCGTGQWAIALAERGARVTAIDLAPEMIRLARNHASARGQEIEWRTGDVTRLTDPLAVFDAIHARALLASVPGALSPIYRASWMRHLPGGDPGNNYLLPWELENLLLEYGWRVIDGWGEWGDDLYGTVNDAAPSLRRAEHSLQQATATTWTTIAV